LGRKVEGGKVPGGGKKRLRRTEKFLGLREGGTKLLGLMRDPGSTTRKGKVGKKKLRTTEKKAHGEYRSRGETGEVRGNRRTNRHKRIQGGRLIKKKKKKKRTQQGSGRGGGSRAKLNPKKKGTTVQRSVVPKGGDEKDWCKEEKK